MLAALGYQEALTKKVMRRYKDKFSTSISARGPQEPRSVSSTPHISAEDLARLERKYGGFVSHVVRHEEGKGPGEDMFKIEQGGDRFNSTHDYGGAYAEYLNKLWGHRHLSG